MAFLSLLPVFKKIFLMWTILKLFDFATVLLLFHVLVFWPQGIWGLSSLTRNLSTYTPYTGRQSLNHWTTKEVPTFSILDIWPLSQLWAFLFFFLAHPCSMQDLSFPTRDWTWVTAVRARLLTTRQPRDSSHFESLLFLLFHPSDPAKKCSLLFRTHVFKKLGKPR